MIANKTACTLQQSLTFLLGQFIKTVLVAIEVIIVAFAALFIPCPLIHYA